MSFSFRNLFAQDDNGSSVPGDRMTGSSRSGTPAIQEYEVSELLPFIPPAIVAQTGVPMDKSIHIILPADGSNDVRLSTIYQSCPSLFAAEITPLNDSVISLPPKAASTAPQPPLSGNPFGNEMELQTETRSIDIMTEERPEPPTLPETSPEAQKPATDLGFSPSVEEDTLSDCNPFSGVPDESGTSSDAPLSGPENSESSEPETSPANPFGDVPEAGSPADSPFEKDSESEAVPENPFQKDSAAKSDFFSSPVDSEETSGMVFGDATPSEEQAKDPGDVVFGTDSDSFATLFSQKANEDEDIPVADVPGEDAPSVGVMLDEQQGENAGPSVESGVSPFAGMDVDEDETEDESFGFGSFLPPKTAEESGEKAADEPTGFASLPVAPDLDDSPGTSKTGSDEASSEVEGEMPALPESWTDQSGESTEEEAGQDEPEGVPPVDLDSMFGAKEEVREVVEKREDDDQDEKSKFSSEPVEVLKETGKTDQGVFGGAPLESGASVAPAGFGFPDPASSETSRAGSDPAREKTAQVPVAKMEPRPVEVSPSPPPSVRSVSPARPSAPWAETGPRMRDIELRAVFATEESFTLTKVSQKVNEMEGVLSCAIVTSDDVVEDFGEEADAIGHKTRELAEHVRCLASVTGVDGASYFTLHMDRAIMSFFFGENHLLGVKHAPEAFQPGTREKLILIARSLKGLSK